MVKPKAIRKCTYSCLFMIFLVLGLIFNGYMLSRRWDPMRGDRPLGQSHAPDDPKLIKKYANLVSPEVMEAIKSARYWTAMGPDYYGKPAPDMVLTDTDGKKHRLSDYKGREVLITIWATWCPPCNAEIPHLIELTNHLPASEFKVLAISGEEGGMDIVRRFAQKKNLNYTTIWESHGKLPKPFCLATSLPSAFFVDKAGNIKLITAGLMDKQAIMQVVQAPAKAN